MLLESAEDVFLQMAIDHAKRTARWCGTKGLGMEKKVFGDRAKELVMKLEKDQRERALSVLMQAGMGL